jgi:hypothetical protein
LSWLYTFRASATNSCSMLINESNQSDGDFCIRHHCTKYYSTLNGDRRYCHQRACGNSLKTELHIQIIEPSFDYYAVFVFWGQSRLRVHQQEGISTSNLRAPFPSLHILRGRYRDVDGSRS